MSKIPPTRVVTGLRKKDHITSALKELRWLPIRARIAFKVATVAYRLRERRQPPYLADLISDYVPTRTLPSSTKTLLAESSFRTNIGRRSFRHVAVKTWNNLPDDIKTVYSLGLFRKVLKTFSFRQSHRCQPFPPPRPRITLCYICYVLSIAYLLTYLLSISPRLPTWLPTKQIVFRRPSSRLCVMPHRLNKIDRFTQIKLFSVIFQDYFNFKSPLNCIMSTSNQRIYWIKLIAWSRIVWRTVGNCLLALIMSRLSYALSPLGWVSSQSNDLQTLILFLKFNEVLPTSEVFYAMHLFDNSL